MFSKKITCSLLAAICTFCAACGKKTVADAGPQFTMATSDFHINGASAGLFLKRDDQASAPTIKIETEKPDTITATEKTLTCGPVKMVGTKRFAGDPLLVTFKFSEDEFKGLSQLPSYTSCTLTVTLTNNVGSTATKNQAVFFTFDKGPALNITRLNFAVGLNAPSVNSEIPLESYEIHNNFQYPVRILYRPVKDAEYVACYHYKSSSEAVGGATGLLSCDKESKRAHQSVIKIEGDYHDFSEEQPHKIIFTLNPNGWARIGTTFTPDQESIMALSGLKWTLSPGVSFNRIFAGIFISSFLTPNHQPLTLEASLPRVNMPGGQIPEEILTPLTQADLPTVTVMRRPESLASNMSQ